MGIAGMPSPMGSQTPSDLGSLSAAAFALLSCSPISGKFWRHMPLKFGKRVEMPLRPPRRSPWACTSFPASAGPCPATEWPACPPSCAAWGPSTLAGPSTVALGGPGRLGLGDPAPWCRADPGPVGTGHQHSHPAPSHWWRCLAPLWSVEEPASSAEVGAGGAGRFQKAQGLSSGERLGLKRRRQGGRKWRPVCHPCVAPLPVPEHEAPWSGLGCPQNGHCRSPTAGAPCVQSTVNPGDPRQPGCVRFLRLELAFEAAGAVVWGPLRSAPGHWDPCARSLPCPPLALGPEACSAPGAGTLSPWESRTGCAVSSSGCLRGGLARALEPRVGLDSSLCWAVPLGRVRASPVCRSPSARGAGACPGRDQPCRTGVPSGLGSQSCRLVLSVPTTAAAGSQAPSQGSS